MSIEDDKRSLARAQATVIGATASGALALCDVFAPGAGMTVGLLGSHARAFLEDRSARRLGEFHDRILHKGLTESEKTQRFRTRIDEQDFVLLIKHLLQDDEDAKVVVYTHLYVLMVEGQIPVDVRSHVLHAAFDLRLADFKLLLRVVDLMGPRWRGSDSEVRALSRLTGADAAEADHGGIERLRLAGLLGPAGGDPPSAPNRYGRAAANLLRPALASD